MKETDRVWVRVQETAIAFGARGGGVSMADARFAILAICSEEDVTLSPAWAVDYLAAELIRMSLAARNTTPDEGRPAAVASEITHRFPFELLSAKSRSQ
jgi:hypothetical protein